MSKNKTGCFIALDINYKKIKKLYMNKIQQDFPLLFKVMIDLEKQNFQPQKK